MKKFIALCLLAFNIAASALAAEIPYIGRVQPEYRAAAEGYLIEATSQQDVERRVKNYVPAQSSITFETVNAKSLRRSGCAALYLPPRPKQRCQTAGSVLRPRRRLFVQNFARRPRTLPEHCQRLKRCRYYAALPPFGRSALSRGT